MFNYFSSEWKLWIWTNIVNGFNKEGIFNVLLNHGFEYNLIKNELGIDPTNMMIWERQYSQQQLLKTSEKNILPLNKSFSDNFNVYRIDSNFLEIYRVPEFITFNECDEIIKQNDDLLNLIDKKIDSFTALNDNLVGESEVKMITGNNKIFPNIGNWSLIIFLENIFENSEIKFPLLEMSFKPTKGEMFIWNNKYPDNTFNPYGECVNSSSNDEGKLVLIKNYNDKNIFSSQSISIIGI